MECKNAYVKPGGRYILCRKSESIDEKSARSLTHGMCGFQRFCPNIRQCVLLPGWKDCLRLRETREEAAREATEEKPNTVKTRRKKGAESE